MPYAKKIRINELDEINYMYHIKMLYIFQTPNCSMWNELLCIGTEANSILVDRNFICTVGLEKVIIILRAYALCVIQNLYFI